MIRQRFATYVTAFLRRSHFAVAVALLAVMFGLGLSSMAGDSATMDEVAHVPAAYSYMKYGDYRLNPEHPPLIKDLAGLPLVGQDVRFPNDEPAWTSEVNGQWEAGWHFLYHEGNDAQKILFWARLPILLLALGFGLALYLYMLRRFGIAAALLTLFFYALSPNIIAHSRYVTTDLGATAFMALALVTFVRYIGRPDRANLLLLSLALAAAQLTKFSSILLYPLLGLLSLVLVLTWRQPERWRERLVKFTGGLVLASALSLLWIWAAYVPHTLNMPGAVQDRLIDGSLYGDMERVKPVLKGLNDVPGFQPLAQYLLGVAMVYNRVDSGNVTYFAGQVTNQSFHWFFPVIFLFKTPVAFLLMMLAALGYALRRSLKRRLGALAAQALGYTRTHLLETTLAYFAAVYFAVSVAGNLNLGIRHILPVYLPLFILVALGLVRLGRRLLATRWRIPAIASLAVLMSWYAASTILIHPSYTAYFNELAGGPAKANAYFSDSSLDWGQDLLRFREYLKEHPEIDQVALDYFGGGDPKYYFCDRRYENGRLVDDASGYDCTGSRYLEWHAQNGPYTGKYIAVSETFLMNDLWYARERPGMVGYAYLREQEPIAKIGYTIYLYKLR